MPAATTEFDLVPDPRILPMLGEINLAPWRCLAELIDNSVDGFLNAQRLGVAIDRPEVVISIPTSERTGARVTIRDNGPGMQSTMLERAVRAGWSGNSPIGNLGMFGMGFNIATARLGTTTTVWTTLEGDAEWHGLRIDFNELQRQRHFRTPHLTRPKADKSEHGTEIIIERLKPEQLAWLAKTANQSRLRRELSQAYSSMLRENGRPVSFRLDLQGRKLAPKNHCTWNETRQVETSRHGTVPAVITIDRRLPSRPFCTACWQWLLAEETSCATCGNGDGVVQRDRHVHGWIGLQRYLGSTDFGIDFVRNGRKIELGNKDLFEWRSEDGVELEYPIDDQRSRGRIVGEIHLDHCRVTYTKDRFDRTDPAWEEMWEIVRGGGPLRPEKARDAGFGANDTPLYRLFQTYRRTSPHSAKSGGWHKVLVVRDNNRAEEMAEKVHKGEPEYLTDAKWWELIEEEDRKALVGGGPNPGPGAGGGLPGFGGGGGDPPPTPPDPPAGGPAGPVAPRPSPPRTPIASLTREYNDDNTGIRWDVRAFAAQAGDPDFREVPEPWVLIRRVTGESDFLVQPGHPAFRSATLTELDALLCQLAWSAIDLTRMHQQGPSFALVLASLRDKYAGTLKLDPVAIKGQADLVLTQIARAWAQGVAEDDCLSLFGELSTAEQDAVYAKMAMRTVGNPQEVIAKGRFLEYAPPRILIRVMTTHPALFFDGKCWDDAYSDIEYPRPAATEEARSRVVRHYEGLLTDVVWLSEQEVEDLNLAPRERLLRAALAIDLLAPVAANEQSGS